MNSDVVDYILPSSEFSKKIFIDNGVDERKLKVIPHGVNIDKFNPNIQPIDVGTKKFKFLTIAQPHARKGLDILVQAFAEEFASTEDVCLVIKTSLVNEKRHALYEVDLKQIIDSIKEKFCTSSIKIITEDIDNLASLYNACDCFVLPTRSECFNLTVLEAIACIKPVITTAYGGHMDYLDENTAYLINYKIVPATQKMQYWHYNPKATIAEPDRVHLRTLMRYVYRHRDEAKNKAQIAYNKIIPNYTWDKVAEQLIDFLISLGWYEKPEIRENKCQINFQFLNVNKDQIRNFENKIKEVGVNKLNQISEKNTCSLFEQKLKTVDVRYKYAPNIIRKRSGIIVSSSELQTGRLLDINKRYVKSILKNSGLKIGIFRTGGYGDAVIASAAILALKESIQIVLL